MLVLASKNMSIKINRSESTLKATKPFSGIEAKPSKIDGMGCFATKAFKRGNKIAEYEGEKISRREIKRRITGATKIHICAINHYWAIDGSVGGNATQFINHSCAPTGDIKIIDDRIFFYAIRDIKMGEELTLDYELSYHDDEYGCRCGAKDCRGKINK
jgi:uncharacterized protein